MDGIDIITQYILAIAPAVTAVIGLIVTLGVGIAKIKNANKGTIESVDRVSKRSENMESHLREVAQENVQLKKELKKVMSKLEHVHIVDKEE